MTPTLTEIKKEYAKTRESMLPWYLKQIAVWIMFVAQAIFFLYAIDTPNKQEQNVNNQYYFLIVELVITSLFVFGYPFLTRQYIFRSSEAKNKIKELIPENIRTLIADEIKDIPSPFRLIGPSISISALFVSIYSFLILTISKTGATINSDNLNQLMSPVIYLFAILLYFFLFLVINWYLKRPYFEIATILKELNYQKNLQ
ncbi:hypothetical protein [Leuconostoc mesenteroides]|uniref:hypothetical protein n=1 Tax=Leuconostoc mesenteroides TaxID=1245 RepID=UPI0005AB1565|nr:hypothetical protein [Leuconostoc mesenteroides]QHM58097.1 hypothetical protein C7M45_00802 [Leuconostoc mesenteroides]